MHEWVAGGRQVALHRPSSFQGIKLNLILNLLQVLHSQQLASWRSTRASP